MEEKFIKIFKNEQCSGSVTYQTQLQPLGVGHSRPILIQHLSNKLKRSGLVSPRSNNPGLQGNLLPRRALGAPWLRWLMDPEQVGGWPQMPDVCQENRAWGTQVLTNHTLNLATLEAKDLHCHFLFDFLEGKGKTLRSFYLSGIPG